MIFYIIFKKGLNLVRNEFIAGVAENNGERVEVAWNKLRYFFCVSEWDALKRAVDNGNKEVLSLLLSYGLTFNKSLVDYAIRFRKYEEAEILLTGVSFNNNVSNDAKFLWTAASEGKLRFIRKVVERGANNQRAMMYALLFKRKDIILFLLSSGTNTKGWNLRYHSRLINNLKPDGCQYTTYIQGLDGSEDTFQMADKEKIFHLELIISTCSQLGHDLSFYNISENFELVRIKKIMKNLKDICRICIRKKINYSTKPVYVIINMLPIPRSLKCYLQYKRNCDESND